jgi:hypothetical protein
MIRFSCPLCAKVLKVADEKAGRVMVCSRCQERCVVPTGTDPRDSADGYVQATRQPSRPPDESHGLFSRMSRGMWCIVVLVVGVAIMSMLFPLLAAWFAADESVPRTLAPWAVILAPCSVVILLVILYGEGTACPRCRKWWARTKVESEFVDREVFDRNGVPFARSLYRTTYQCAACRHRWSVTQADEYRQPSPRPEKQCRR